MITFQDYENRIKKMWEDYASGDKRRNLSSYVKDLLNENADQKDGLAVKYFTTFLRSEINAYEDHASETEHCYRLASRQPSLGIAVNHVDQALRAARVAHQAKVNLSTKLHDALFQVNSIQSAIDKHKQPTNTTKETQ